MPQVITPPIAGIMLGIGPDGVGQIKILTGVGDPNNSETDSSAGDVATAAIGSLFLRMDGSTSTSLYVKTALPNTWTAK
jgi:hypothetical protein